MDEKARHEYLLSTFKEFFGGWKVDDWHGIDDNTIQVKLTDGRRFIFGDRGEDEWHLERVKANAVV